MKLEILYAMQLVIFYMNSIVLRELNIKDKIKIKSTLLHTNLFVIIPGARSSYMDFCGFYFTVDDLT